MSDDCSLDAVVDGAFAAALDDTLWDDWARLASARLGGVGASLWVLDASAERLDRFALYGRSAQVTDTYLADWGPHDPQLSYASTLTRTTIYTSADHVDLGLPATAAFNEWQRHTVGIDHHLALAVQIEGRQFAGLSVHRGAGEGPAPTADRLRLQLVLPDIERAMRLGFRHNRLLDDAFWDGIAAAPGRQAALLIDDDGKVIRLTDRAIDLLAAKPGVTLQGSRIVCADRETEAAVCRMLGEAARPIGPRSGAARIGPAGYGSLIVVAYPLARERRRLAAGRAAALVLLVDPAERRQSDTRLYAQAFGLTRREAELCGLLTGGHNVESAAHVLGVSMATARVHLRHVFAKSGVDRQPELVRLLLSIRG